MLKQCIFCNKDYEVTRGCALKKSKYCSKHCRFDYWLKAGNKSGKFMGNKLALGKQIKLTQTLSDIQRQFIIGTLLGDACISLSRKGSPNLMFQHTEKNLDYVLLKTEILKNFIVREKPTFCKARNSKPFNGRIFHSKASYATATVTHQDFEEFNNLFYSNINGKRTKIFNLQLPKIITSLSLLFWYMDDGHLGRIRHTSNYVKLATNNFSEEENLRIKIMFNENFKLDPSMYLNKSQGRYYLRFNKKDTFSFMSILKPHQKYIPHSLFYKFTFLRQ